MNGPQDQSRFLETSLVRKRTTSLKSFQILLTNLTWETDQKYELHLNDKKNLCFSKKLEIKIRKNESKGTYTPFYK